MKPADAFREAVKSFNGAAFTKEQLAEAFYRLVNGGRNAQTEITFRNYFTSFQRRAWKGLQIVRCGEGLFKEARCPIMPLSRTQQASSRLSQMWKEQSGDLLRGARNIIEFKDAVIWCGKGGNVMRTIPSAYTSDFAQHLWDNKERIMSGEYDLEHDLPSFGGKCPSSWASKVIHAMNPQGYPYIYDSNIRSAMGINDLADYGELIQEERGESSSMTNAEIYKRDSDVWASKL